MSQYISKIQIKPWQHPIKQLFRLLSLYVQLIRALPDKFFQVVGIFFKHLKHGVDKIYLSPVV
jgi:hypothetical protein